MFLLSAIAQGAPLIFETLDTPEGPVTYAVLAPKGKGPHQGVLALPPGPQTKAMVEAGLAKWQDDFVQGGFLVVSPVAPETGLYTTAESHARLPALMDHVAREHRLAAGGWSLFGISNGGRSALVIGPAYPERFRNLTVLPGAVRDPETLAPFGKRPVTWVVGSRDAGWVESSQRGHAWLSANGGQSELVVLDGLGHSAFQSVSFATLKGWITR